MLGGTLLTKALIIELNLLLPMFLTQAEISLSDDSKAIHAAYLTKTANTLRCFCVIENWGYKLSRPKKPCPTCNSLERYNNGGCKPCQRRKQTARNNACATGHGKLKAANGKARSVAKFKGESMYETVDSCYKCDTKLRYTCSGNCVACQYWEIYLGYNKPTKTPNKSYMGFNI